jgi:GTP-binding protein 1
MTSIEKDTIVKPAMTGGSDAKVVATETDAAAPTSVHEAAIPGVSMPDIRVAIVGNVDSGMYSTHVHTRTLVVTLVPDPLSSPLSLSLSLSPSPSPSSSSSTGKSTMIGVLTSGHLDNGRGAARARVFAHRHEASSGRTSCVSQHVLGFAEDGSVVHQTVPNSANATQKNKSYREIVSKSKSLMTLVDLAGHERYLKTTIAGLTGSYPDYAMVVIGANAGITKMTREHLGVTIALNIPVMCVVTKIDMAPANVLARSKKQMHRILKSKGAHKKPFDVRSEADVELCLANISTKMVPIFYTSTVTGDGLDLLKKYLAGLQPRFDAMEQQQQQFLAKHEKKELAQDAADPDAKEHTVTATGTSLSSAANATDSDAKHTTAATDEHVEFVVDETFVVPGVGLVVSGTVVRGTLHAASQLMLGPFGDSSFRKVMVKSIHCKRMPQDMCTKGNMCSMAIKSVNRRQPLRRIDVRRGMVLVPESSNPRPVRRFLAEVLVLHHPTTIKTGYQAVIHCGMVRQTAALRYVTQADCLRTGDRAQVEFCFIQRAEFMHPGQVFIFREGSTKGVGRILEVFEHMDSDALPTRLRNQMSNKAIHHAHIAASAAASASAAVSS